MYIFDLHQDISDSILYTTHADFWSKNSINDGWNDVGVPVNNQTDYPRLKDGNVGAVFAVTCAVEIKPSDKNKKDPAVNIGPPDNHFTESIRHIDLYYDLVEKSQGKIKFLTSKNDLNLLGRDSMYFLLALEGADSISESLEELKVYHKRGVRSIGLTWSYSNNLAGGCNDISPGLTTIGERTIQYMNNNGMLLDLAHINKRSFFEALEVNNKPIIISHTGSRQVFNHPRNVTDEQIKAVKKSGGVIGIFGVPRMIGDVNNKKITLVDVVRHIQHIVEIAGIDHVALGSDFGAMMDTNLIKDFEHTGNIPNIFIALHNAGFSQTDIELIAHKNIERVLAEVLLD